MPESDFEISAFRHFVYSNSSKADFATECNTRKFKKILKNGFQKHRFWTLVDVV